MKANEFVKKFGLSKAKEFSKITIKGLSQRYCFEINTGDSIGLDYVDLNDLKRLVESHELVEGCGGIDVVKQHLKDGNVFRFEEKPLMKQAIADVESCMGVSSESN